MLDFLKAEPALVARKLLGWRLVRTIDDTKLVGTIVETEAYHQSDAASHSYKGKTPRTEVMFGPHGRAYIYFTYGMHYCFNVVTGEAGEGSAVLIRALEPTDGIDVMKSNRPLARDEISLTNGPAKLCQALNITTSLNGHSLTRPPLMLKPPLRPVPASRIQVATRIGISRDVDRPWRFYVKDNQFISKK